MRRWARTSSAKSLSGRGALAISARKRSADRSCALGGPITATEAPLRVNSISSPAATRVNSSEKFRAASVAVMWATVRIVSDKSENLAGIPVDVPVEVVSVVVEVEVAVPRSMPAGW